MRPSDLKSLKLLLGEICAELVSAREAIKEHTASVTHQEVEKRQASQKDWEEVQEILARPHRTDPNEQATAETNQERRHWQNFGLQGLLTIGTWLAFVAAAIYAGTAYHQLTEMRIANEIAKTQWHAEHRPWIGISGVGGLPNQMKFTVFTDIDKFTRPGSTARALTGVDMNVAVRAKNYGISPAFKVNSRAEVVMTEDTGIDPPPFEMKSTCSLSDQPMEIEGNVVFPNTDSVSNSDEQKNQLIALSKLQRVWILGCISYREISGGTPHHTKFWIFSNLIQVSESTIREQQEVNRGGRTVKYIMVPVPGWNLLKTEAD
jgi:hypothetical protein